MSGGQEWAEWLDVESGRGLRVCRRNPRNPDNPIQVLWIEPERVPLIRFMLTDDGYETLRLYVDTYAPEIIEAFDQRRKP